MALPNSKTLASFASLLVVWELAVRLLGVKLYILPPPYRRDAHALGKMDTVRHGGVVHGPTPC